MLKYALKNIKNYILNEKILFVITLICIIVSVFAINFSYGLYYNYNTKVVDSEIGVDGFNIKIVKGETVTKGELQKYAESLDNKTLNAMIVIYAGTWIDEYKHDDGYGPLPMRFVIHDGKYGICEETKKNWEQYGLITSGRFITNEEEANAENVALVWADDPDEWEEASERIRDGNYIKLFGKKYKVIGTYKAMHGPPIVPFLTIPDDIVIDELGFSFEKNLTKSIYDDMVKKAQMVLPGKLKFPELTFPDSDTISSYNNIIYIALILSIICVANFSVLFYYILQKRKRKLAIMRLNGCTKLNAVFMYLTECIIFVLPCYSIGTLINYALCEKYFNNVFEYFKQAYTPQIYIFLFAVYFISFIVITTVLIISVVNKTITETMKEAVK